MRKIIALVFLLYVCAIAGPGDRSFYEVDNFSGGLNLLDSLHVAPNEALQLDNYVLDRFSSLHKRYGIVNWNDSLISGGHIRDIAYVEQKNGDKYMYVATDSFVFQVDGWTDTVTAWSGKEIDYTRGTIDSTTNSAQKYIYGDTTSWILSVQEGDKIQLQGGGSIYTIDSVLADTLLKVTANITVIGDTFAAYRILKAVQGNPQLSRWNGNLYVADDAAPAWWYDGSEPHTLSIVDSGTVTTQIVVDTTAVAYDSGTARIENNSNIVVISGSDITDTAFTVGNIFHARYRQRAQNFAGWVTCKIDSRIIGTAVLSADTVIYIVADGFDCGTNSSPPDLVYLPDSSNAENRWWIDQAYVRRVIEQSQYLEDSNKVWNADYYQGLYIVNAKNSRKAAFISGNTERRVSFESKGVFQTSQVQPTSANDSYNYIDTINGTEILWASPGSGTDIAMVCDSMVKFINDEAAVSDFVTATDSTTYYLVKSDTMGLTFTIATDTAQQFLSGSVANDSTKVVFAAGDRYYVGWQFPAIDSSYWAGLPDFRKQWSHETIFSNIIFHRNRLYAIGYDLAKQTSISWWYPYPSFDNNDILNTGRVWFSDIGIPSYIPPDWNFDISGANNTNRSISLFSNDRCRSQFILRDDLYIITNSNIYRISGEIDPYQDDLGIYLTQAIRGVGSNQPDGIITTKDNVAYIMNQEGIWKFDGRIIEKISYKIGPLNERYRKSSMVTGQFKENLLFSYPHSNVTIVLHEPTGAFGLWRIGMESINSQFVAIDSNYFLFSTSTDSAYVLRYPSSGPVYYDIYSTGDTTEYTARYKSGWFNPGKSSFRSVLDRLDIIAYNTNVSSLTNVLRIRGDFADSILWDSTAFAGGGRYHHFNPGFGADNGKDVWQIEVADSTRQDFFISGYKVRAWDTSR